MVSLKKFFCSMPVGLVKALKPLGHSGHRRLQDVVGSNEIDTGKPHCTGFLKKFEINMRCYANSHVYWSSHQVYPNNYELFPQNLHK